MLKHCNLLFFILLSPLLSISQGVSVLPTHFPDYVYGTWVNTNNEVILAVFEDYIKVKNELYGYNDIVRDGETLHFTCVQDYNVKYISVSRVDASTILLDEGLKVSQLFKLENSTTNKLPKALIHNWYNSNNKIQLLENEVLFSNISYKVDNVITANDINFHIVLYNEGVYYLLYNFVTEDGHFVTANFKNIITFKKASFVNKNKIVFIVLLVLLLSVIIYYLLRWKIASTRKKEINKRLFTEMQLKAIRSQMNPHFLFNALSAIQNLINKGDNEKANHYLTEFSQLMRLTLEKSEKGLVDLEEEVESIKKYLELERLRFPFEYTLDIDSKINLRETEIPAMLIQPFLENAILHGLNNKKGKGQLGLKLKIENENLIAIITDNGIGINATASPTTKNLNTDRYGLKLAKDRIKLINENYNTEAKIRITDISEINSKKTGTRVEIFMPFKY